MEGRPARLTGSTGELTECYERNAGFQNYWGEPHPCGSISLLLEKSLGEEAPNFLRRNLLTRFFFAVIRPRRKTPGSPSIDDRGHNNCGIPTFLTKHFDNPLQYHQDIRGGGTATDVAPPQLEHVRVDPLYPLQVQVVHLSHSLSSHAVMMDDQLPRDISLSFSLIQSLNRRTKLSPKTNAFMVPALIWSRYASLFIPIIARTFEKAVQSSEVIATDYFVFLNLRFW